MAVARTLPPITLVAAVTLVTAVALTCLGCEAETQTSGTPPPVAPATVQATAPGTRATAPTSPASDATAPDAWVMTTSAESYAFSRAAMTAALELGDAVIAYLRGQIDLATVQSLVAPTAHGGLAQMLSSLNEPTDCVVN